MKIDASAFKELKIYFSRPEHSDSVKLTVVSADKLGTDEKEALQSFLEKKGLKDIKLEEKVDKGILGGIILIAGSTVIDLSLRGQLSNLRKELYAIT